MERRRAWRAGYVFFVITRPRQCVWWAVDTTVYAVEENPFKHDSRTGE
jgi:hypothetical protein